MRTFCIWLRVPARPSWSGDLCPLDEATSHLDVANEQVVNAAVRQLAVTKVIVAHRPETIASADRVLVMHGGKIVQDQQVLRQGAVEEG